MLKMPGRILTNMATQRERTCSSSAAKTKRTLNIERAECLAEAACYSLDKNRQRKVIVWLRVRYMLFSSERSSVMKQVLLEESSKSRYEQKLS